MKIKRRSLNHTFLSHLIYKPFFEFSNILKLKISLMYIFIVVYHMLHYV